MVTTVFTLRPYESMLTTTMLYCIINNVDARETGFPGLYAEEIFNLKK